MLRKIIDRLLGRSVDPANASVGPEGASRERQSARTLIAPGTTPKSPKRRKPRKKRASKKRPHEKLTRNPRYGRSGDTRSDYHPQGDGTAIDSFVLGLREHLLPLTAKWFVSGLTGPPRRWRGRGRGRAEWIRGPVPCPDSNFAIAYLKAYKVGLQVDPSSWGLSDLVEQTRTPVSGSDRDAYYRERLQPIILRVQPLFDGFQGHELPESAISAGVRSDGTVRLWLTVWLEITARDAAAHLGRFMTSYPAGFQDEVASLLDVRFRERPELLGEVYTDLDVQYSEMRRQERALKRLHGIPDRGSRFVSETALFETVRRRFPNAVREHSPRWLGRQRFDIYIPGLKIAIEYQGIQHYEPVEIFGGQEGLVETRSRDQKKRDLAKRNGVLVLDWPYTREISADTVDQFFSEHGIGEPRG